MLKSNCSQHADRSTSSRKDGPLTQGAPNDRTQDQGPTQQRTFNIQQPNSSANGNAWGRKDKRNAKLAYKERGSLVHTHRSDVTLPIHHRHHQEQPSFSPKPKKNASVVEKKVKVDVFIPSTVSVGTLARLLKVSLSGYFFLAE